MRRYDVAVDLAVRLEAGHRGQQRLPLVVIDGAADVRHRGQQYVVLRIEDPRRVVGPLDMRPETDEMVGLVAEHRPECDAAEQMRAHLHPIEEIREAARLDPVVVVAAHLDPGGIQVLVHFRCDRAAYRARRFARRAEARVDR